MKKSATALALLGWVLFVCSLWLPAASLAGIEFFGLTLQGDDVVQGWQAVWLSIACARDMLHDREALVMFTHGVTNALVLGGPFLVLLGRVRRSRWLAHLTVLATLYNLCLGWQLDVPVQVGYYVWVASFVAVSAALYLTPKSPGVNRTMSSNYGVQLSVGAPSSPPPRPEGRLRAACS